MNRYLDLCPELRIALDRLDAEVVAFRLGFHELIAEHREPATRISKREHVIQERELLKHLPIALRKKK
jgi:hypothetical protein